MIWAAFGSDMHQVMVLGRTVLSRCHEVFQADEVTAVTDEDPRAFPTCPRCVNLLVDERQVEWALREFVENALEES